MAELRRTFVAGRMNKDLDERLVPQGEYRDAQNIEVSTSEGSDVGAVQSVMGNTQLSVNWSSCANNLNMDLSPNAVCVGEIGRCAETSCGCQCNVARRFVPCEV